MQIKMITKFRETPLLGWIAYEYDFAQLEVKSCRWYAYPIFRIPINLKRCRTYLYHWLNDIGVMHTSPGCRMQLSDIWKK